MKKRIISLLVTLVLAISVVIGVSVFANAESTDGLKSTAISLVENVTLKMEVAIAAPTEGAYAKITLPDEKVDATQLVATAPKKGDNYVFTAEVAVKDLADDVTIEICNADGTTLVAAATTTALAYCNSYTEGEYLGIVNALKAYAVAADAYFDKDKTADSAPTADFSKVADVVTSGTLPAGLTHRSATLLLESETTIRHYFELAQGKSIDGYTFFVDLDKDGKADAGEALNAKSKSTEDGKTVYFVDVEGLTPNQLDELYTVATTDGTDTYTCDYGVLTYAKRAYAGGDLKAKNLAAALLAYSNEAGKLTGTITFNVDGGSAVEAQTYEYGVTTAVSANTTKNGFTLIGWFDEYGNRVTGIPASSTGNITLNAKWGATYFNEQFTTDVSTPITAGGSIGSLNVNGNNGNSSYTAKDGHLVWTSTAGYGFVYPNNTKVRDAESDLVTVTVKLARPNGENVAPIYLRVRDAEKKDTNPFSISSGDNAVKVDGKAIMSIPEIKDGYATLHAVLDFGNETVYYYDGDYTLLYTQSVSGLNHELRKNLHSTVTISLVCGAFNNQTLTVYVDSFELREGKIDYKVEPTEERCTVTFDSNGGSAVEDMTYIPGVEAPITAVPTLAGYSFIGWFDAEGNRVDKIAEDATGNIALTAKWGAIYVSEQFDTEVSAPITAAGTIGGLSVNGSNGASSFTVSGGHLTWAATGKYATVSPGNNSVREASSDVITITLVLARADGAIVPHIDYRFRANNGSNSDINIFTINTNDNNVKANGTEIIKIPEAKDGYVTLKVVFDFSSGLVSFYNASNALIYSYTPNLPNGYTSFAEFRSKLVNNAPNLYVSGYKSGADSILYVDFYEIREGGVN